MFYNLVLYHSSHPGASAELSQTGCEAINSVFSAAHKKTLREKHSLFRAAYAALIKIVGGCQIPSIHIAENRPIGKWGRLRKRFLKEQHPLLFSELLLSEQLYPHLLEIDETCTGRLELLTRQMAEREGVTEDLKAANQMGWVRRMNSIRSRAEEKILNELVYSEEAEDDRT